MELTYQSIGYGGSDLSFAAAADNTISESFNKADGALGPGLTWTPQVFGSAPFHWQVVSNQARYLTNTAGTWEDLQVPSPNVDSPNVQVSFQVTNLTRTGTGDYWIAGGITARTQLLEGGTAYRAYACEIGRNNLLVPPAELWSLIIWRVDRGPLHGGTGVRLLTVATLPLANVTLPGTLTFTCDANRLAASFTHAGSGGTMTVETFDSAFTDGFVGLGGGNVISGTDSGSVTIDAFSAVGDDANVTPDSRGFLWVRNTDASSKTVGVTVPGYMASVAYPDVSVTVPAGERRLIGPLAPELAVVSGGRPLVAVNYSPNVTGVSAAAVRVP